MNLLVSLTGLVLACVAFFSYDLISFQASLIRNLAAEARIVGSNSVSALLFNDKEAALNTLTALSGSRDILGAAIVGNDGKVFAGYRSREGGQCVFHLFPPAGINSPGSPAEMCCWRSGLYFKDIRRDCVHFCATRRARCESSALYRDRCGDSAALPGNRNDRHRYRSVEQVPEPIVALAEMSRAVSKDRNYSLRAPPSRDRDEVSVLIDAFNEMLAQIEQRDLALRHAKDELEERVQERTTELKTASS